MSKQSHEHKSILIVEDDEATREAFSLILAQNGYRVETAMNGQAALEQLRSSELPGLILLDLMMPGMDGMEFQAHLAGDERLSEIPVLICSAAGERVRRRLTIQPVGFLEKPVDPPTLLAAVDQYCA
jgi:CheY-like chemotaxis protein